MSTDARVKFFAVDSVQRADAFSVLDDYLKTTVETHTLQPFTEGAWVARRAFTAGPREAAKHTLWWTRDGSRVLTGSEGDGVCLEDGYGYVATSYKGGSVGHSNWRCDHYTPADARLCALIFLVEGVFCSEYAPMRCFDEPPMKPLILSASFVRASAEALVDRTNRMTDRKFDWK